MKNKFSSLISDKSNNWSVINDNETFRRMHFATDVYNNRYILVAGGINEKLDQPDPVVYDTYNEIYVSLPQLPIRFQVCCGAFCKNVFYIIGDDDMWYINIPSFQFPHNSTRKLAESVADTDIEVMEWKEIPIPPNVSIDTDVVVSNETHLFLFCGQRDYQQMFDPNSRKWQEIPSMSIQTCNFAMAIVGDNIFKIGGHRSREHQSSVEIFHIPSQTWSLGPPTPEPLYRSAATAIGCYIIVTGGLNDALGDPKKTFILDSRTLIWTTNYHSPVFPPRNGHACVSVGRFLYCIGGLGRNMKRFPLERIHQKYILPDLELVFCIIKLRKLIDLYRAFPKRRSKRNKKYIAPMINERKANSETVAQTLIMDLNCNLFRYVLSFLLL